MTKEEKIQQIITKWHQKGFQRFFDEDPDLLFTIALQGAIIDTIEECSEIVNSMRSSGETDLRSVRSIVSGFQRWDEFKNDES